jgi:hypothetical protein
MLREVTDSLPPVQAGTIAHAERTVGAALPDQYKRFLEKHNGGRLKPDTFPVKWDSNPECARRFPSDSVHYLFGMGDGDDSEFLRHLDLYRSRIPDDTVPVGMDPGGNLILLGIRDPNTNKVFLWVKDYEVEEGEPPDYSNVGLVAQSFDEFLKALYDD